ncbi:lipocalin-like domain-containing protein [Nitrobacter sp. JJSN]|uniref:lipocalin-like domain-containing protein n=1 Tax=Nitrobacter sp. JJSN TaxID=3453033 RepID=UPI003F776D22
MSVSAKLTRRAFATALAVFGLDRRLSLAQGFAGLGVDASGFATVTPGRKFVFPDDHGPHPDYRIEWWYLTANLRDAAGNALGVQWTLFRQAMQPGPQREGWANQQIWMGHAAVTRADTHRYSETFARGGIGQAGADADPFRAWIDSWQMRGLERMSAINVSPLRINASGADFSYALKLDAIKLLVLEGDAGYSVKSESGQASYYYSQPYFTVDGTVTIDSKSMNVSGQAWMDREWSSQPLASDQTGWDWFSLHLGTGEKLMLFRLRQTQGMPSFAGNWIGLDGQSVALSPESIDMTPVAMTDVADRKLPTSWRIAIRNRGVRIETIPLNPRSWMGTSVAYWEGPVSFTGTHRGVGYLEMTGY